MEKTLRIWHIFRTISVQHEKITQTCDFFRTISVHFSAKSGNLFFFPEHVRSQGLLSCALFATGLSFFRSISVHSFEIFHYLCTVKSKLNSANMAGTIKDMMTVSANRYHYSAWIGTIIALHSVPSHHLNRYHHSAPIGTKKMLSSAHVK